MGVGCMTVMDLHSVVHLTVNTHSVLQCKQFFTLRGLLLAGTSSVCPGSDKDLRGECLEIVVMLCECRTSSSSCREMSCSEERGVGFTQLHVSLAIK